VHATSRSPVVCTTLAVDDIITQPLTSVDPTICVDPIVASAAYGAEEEEAEEEEEEEEEDFTACRVTKKMNSTRTNA